MARSIPSYATFIEAGTTALDGTATMSLALGSCPTIASLSLGAARRFQVRHRRTKHTITVNLKMGDWLIMAGQTQRFWLHQVPKMAATVAPRVNLTFRHMMPSPSPSS